MSKVYKCTVKNFWNGRRWDDGAYIPPLSSPPPGDYFRAVTDKEELKEIRDQYDPEDDKDTFSALTRIITERHITGEGMLATVNPKDMKFNDLRSYAAKKGVATKGMNREQILAELEEMA